MSAITINIDTSLTNIPTINIGRQGENAATQVVFDVSEMITTYGSGTATVVIQRQGDLEPYMHDDATQSGNDVTWTVTSADTEVAGYGVVQIFWTVSDELAKTVSFGFYVEPALTDPTDAPATESGWISEEIGDLDSLTTTAKTDLVSAINELDESPYISGNTLYFT